MSEVKRYRMNVEVDAVRFNGSTTQTRKLKEWIAGGEYHAPGVATRDITTFGIETAEGKRTVRNGDYILKEGDQFFHWEPDDFEALFELVEGGDDDGGS